MTDDARSRVLRGRALSAFAALAVAASVGLVVLAFGGDGSDTVFDVETVVAEATPSTIPPLDPVDAPSAGAGEDETGTAGELAAAPADSEAARLAELLGPSGSAIPIETPVPTGLLIDELDLWSPVRAVGLEENGELEVPDETETGWYRYGSTPGRRGATVFAAHLAWNDTYGPFYRLGELELGDLVEVELDDGTTRTYAVTERTMYDKDSLPRERIWRRTGPETLVMITCGGSFNPEIRRYRQNIVVYAVPVA